MARENPLLNIVPDRGDIKAKKEGKGHLKKIPVKKRAKDKIDAEEVSLEEIHFNQRELEKDREAGRTMKYDRDDEARKRTMEFEAEQGERKNVLDELKKKEEENAKVYNEIRGKNDASRSFLKKTLGAGSDTSQEVSDVRLIWLKSLEEWGKQSLVEINEKLNRGEITSEDFEVQRLEIRNNIALRKCEVLRRGDQKREDQGIKRGWLSEKVANGSEYILEKYKKLPFLVKLGLGVGFGITGGYYAVAGLGAMRFLGGIISGKATHDKLQSSAEWWRKRSSLKDIAHEEKQYEKEGLAIQEKLERTMKSLEGMSDRIDAKAKEEGYFDVVRKLAAWTVGGIVGSGTLARAWSELGIGRAVSEKIQHVLGLDHGAVPEAAGAKGAITPEGTSGKGAIIPEKIEKPFLGDTHTIKSGENAWKVTRDMYVQHADKYGYDPNNPKLKSLFQSLKEQGFLKRMGINADNFNNLSEADKIKIFAENKTANTMEWYKGHHGGKLPSVVNEGYMVTLDDKGKLFVGNTSHVGAEAVHHAPTHGAGRAAVENYGGRGHGAAEAYSGKGGVDTSQFDQQIEAARTRGINADIRGKNAVAGLAEAAQTSNEQAIAGAVSANSRLWNMWLEKGVGNGFRPSTPAREVWEGIKNLDSGITSDQPLALPAGEMIDRERVVEFTQDMFKRFSIKGQETMAQYIERLSRSNFTMFNNLSKFYRL